MTAPKFKWTKLPPEPFVRHAEEHPRYRLECSNGLSAVMTRVLVRPALYYAELLDRDGERFADMRISSNLRNSKLEVQERLQRMGEDLSLPGQ